MTFLKKIDVAGRKVAAGLTPRSDASRRFSHSFAALLAAAGFAGAVTPAHASAQQKELRDVVPVIDSVRADGTVKSIPLGRKGFSLFAEADIAVGSIRDGGQYRSPMSNQGGPNGEAAIANRILNQSLGFNPAGAAALLFFENGFIFGAPPSEFRKIRTVHPGVNNMVGSLGYTVQFWFTIATPNIRRVSAADGQFGVINSGIAVAFNSTCRDDPTFLRESITLLPMRDCPETLGPRGFEGKLVVPDSVWLNTFIANPSAFRWDDWRISRTRLEANNFLGTASTYGFMSDYAREQRIRYGSVVPGGAGTPTEGGYPLGLEIRTDAWNFNAPATRNVQFYQTQLVNRSADVYGAGIDYDSLYFGSAPGFAFSSQNNHSVYVDFGTNTFYAMRAGISGMCAAGRPRIYTGTTLGGCPLSAGAGAAALGIYTWTWLKSPLGDVRNKRFSRAGDPYFNPTSPLADDTITFNHSKPNGFGNFSANIGRSTRSGFGMISSTEDNYLDGRQPSEFPINQFVQLFAPEVWTGVVPSAVDARFNKFVPGSTTNPATGQPFGAWDYNNDGIQDTIAVPACGVQGCAGLYSDTIAGGFRNQYLNVLNTVTAGPFALRAGDTTQFLWAYSYANDTVQTRLNIEGATASYLANYEGPTPFVFPATAVGETYTIVSAELTDSLRGGVADGSVGAQIVIRMPNISGRDNFMLRAVERVRQDSIANIGRTRSVLALNPGLLGRLRVRANDNLASVLIFKSCDGGTTFTTSTGNVGTCISAPTRSADAGFAPFPWRPFATVGYNNGVPALQNVNEFVQAGREYLYSFVTQTRGYSDFQIVDSIGGQLAVSNVELALGVPRDSIRSALSGAGPSTIRVYAPITNAAGRSFASVDTATLSGNASQGVGFAGVGNNVSGTTRVIFANQFVVRRTLDTLTQRGSTTISARFIVPRAQVGVGGTPSNLFVAREQTFSANENIPVRVGVGFVNRTQRSIAGGSIIQIDTVNSPAGQIGYLWVTGDDRPIFAIDNQFGGNQARDQVASPLYPNYLLQLRDTASANGFRQEEINFQGVAGISLRDRNFVIRAPGDTITGDAQTFLPQVRPILGTVAFPARKLTLGGRYDLTWQTDPWGPGAPFRLDPISGLQTAVTASLQRVAALATTVTDTSAAVNARLGGIVRPLQRVRVPFSMTFTNTEGRTEPVRFAMRSRPNTRLLGSGGDTIRVTIPDSLWMPGDTLFALHQVERDSIIGTGVNASRVLVAETLNGVAGFRAIPVVVDSVGISGFLVSCLQTPATSGARPVADNATCNPLTLLTRGSSPQGGYLPVGAGWRQVFELARTFDARSTIALTATPFSSGNVVTREQLRQVSVVPNPFIARSSNDVIAGGAATATITFTGLPDQGILRIYSVSGQWLQELTYTQSDLIRAGNDAPTGDLPYNLRSREGLDLTSGLYLYVLTATGPNGRNQVQRGKFVIIR